MNKDEMRKMWEDAGIPKPKNVKSDKPQPQNLLYKPNLSKPATSNIKPIPTHKPKPGNFGQKIDD